MTVRRVLAVLSLTFAFSTSNAVAADPARVARLAEQLDRVELDLIRGEGARLERADGFGPGTMAAFDFLYDRLGRLAGGPLGPQAAGLGAELARVEADLIGREVERVGRAKGLTPEAVDQLDRLRARVHLIPLRGGPPAPADRLLVPRVTPPDPHPLPPPNLFAPKP